MHKNSKIVFLSAFILAISLTLAAQEKSNSANRTITKEEYYSTIRKAYEKTQTQKHRIKYTSENNSPTVEDKRILLTEFVPPNRERYVFDFYEDDNLRHYEEIQIGKTSYVRFDSENWRRKTEEDIARGYGRGTDIKIEYLYVGRESVNNQTADLYQKTEISGYPNLPNSKPVIETEKYWINADGSVVKYFFSTTDSSLGTLVNRTKDYEYDSTIQIDTPTVRAVRRKNVKKNN